MINNNCDLQYGEKGGEKEEGECNIFEVEEAESKEYIPRRARRYMQRTQRISQRPLLEPCVLCVEQSSFSYL